LQEHEEASGMLLQNLRKFKAGATFIGYGNDPRLLACCTRDFARP
jgi:hypothetical protein